MTNGKEYHGPSLSIPDEVSEFLRSANPAVMASIARDGRPVAAATWYLQETNRSILISFDASRARLSHLRREPRFALDVLDGSDWYTHVSLQLEAVAFADDEGLGDIDSIAAHYTGREYLERGRRRVSVRSEIKSFLSWGTLRAPLAGDGAGKGNVHEGSDGRERPSR